MSVIYYDQESAIKANQYKTLVTFDNTPESKILDTGNILILSNLQKPWTIACKDISRVFEIEYSTYRILNRSELCECSLTAGNYLLSQTDTNCGDMPEARDGYFFTYYAFNKIILDIITVKFDIQVDDRTITQSTLLHDDIPGYNLLTRCTIPVPVIVLCLSAIFVHNINSFELHFQSVALRSQYSDHAPEAVTLH